MKSFVLLLGVVGALAVRLVVASDPGGLPSWAVIPMSLGGYSVLAGGFLFDKLMLTAKHERAIDGWKARLVEVEADCAAWKGAHGAEVDARVAAQRTAAVMLDQIKTSTVQTQLTEKLIDVLMSSVTERNANG